MEFLIERLKVLLSPALVRLKLLSLSPEPLRCSAGACETRAESLAAATADNALI